MKTSIRSVEIFFALLCLTSLPNVQAVNPPPDGGYPGFNTAEGQNALLNLDIGAGALANTAVGWFALSSNVDNDFSTAVGAGALLFNRESNNTAVGAAALLFNDQGSANTAIGAAALLNNVDGFEHTACGSEALLSDTTGVQNTAFGAGALRNTTTGGTNVAVGRGALVNNTTGSGNNALGFNAGVLVTTANNVISIGSVGGNVDNSCFIGNIFGAATVNVGTPVLVDSAGQLGTISSSRRFKHDIKPMDKASEAILALKPVTFRYMSDRNGVPQFGLIAEEVAAVNPDLVVRDDKGEIYSVRYEQVNAMLLNEFLKEHRRVEELKSEMAQQKKETEALVARLNEQEARLEKVSARFEMRQSDAPLVVGNE